MFGVLAALSQPNTRSGFPGSSACGPGVKQARLLAPNVLPPRVIMAALSQPITQTKVCFYFCLLRAGEGCPLPANRQVSKFQKNNPWGVEPSCSLPICQRDKGCPLPASYQFSKKGLPTPSQCPTRSNLWGAFFFSKKGAAHSQPVPRRSRVSGHRISAAHSQLESFFSRGKAALSQLNASQFFAFRGGSSACSGCPLPAGLPILQKRKEREWHS